MILFQALKFTTCTAALGLQGYGAWCVIRRGLCVVAGKARFAEARHDVEDIETAVATGAYYEPSYRDCISGEQHDVVVPEIEDSGDGADGDADDEQCSEAPTGARGPTSRRLARKKVVHKVYEGTSGIVHKPFLGDVIAQARNVYNAGASDHYHRQLARMFMVRLMSAAGMRPAHINYHIDEMVVAVFLHTERQLTAARQWESAEMLKRIRPGRN